MRIPRAPQCSSGSPPHPDTATDLAVPLEPTRFIVNISRELARTEPQLISDFLTEFFVSWQVLPEEQKPLSLECMAPWLSALRTSVMTGDTDGKGWEKVASLFRKFIDLVVLDQGSTHALDHYVWPAVAQDELLLEIFLDELKTSLSYSARAETLSTLSAVMVGIGTISLRSRIFSRLRKALNRSSLRPTRLLPDNVVWPEICDLLQFCLALLFNSGVQSQMFLPEVFHVVTMLWNTGGQGVRLVACKLLVNTIHAVCSSFTLDDARVLRLRASLDLLCEPRGGRSALPSTLVHDGAPAAPTAQEPEPTSLAATGSLAAVLLDVCSDAALSVDMANAWRARWMSLVASTAFQNPAVQARAFAVMGYLAREVDDDLYQVLIALRGSVCQFGEDGNSEMLVSIVTSLAKMMAKLPSASRYGVQLFWLAMLLVRLVPLGLFNCAAQFLEAVLTSIETVGNMRGERVVPLVLQSRSQLEEAALPLDDAYGIRFDEAFHFAVCASLVRRLTEAGTRLAAIRVLSSLLEMTSWTAGSPTDCQAHAVRGSPYLALMLACGVGHEKFMDGLWWAEVGADGIGSLVGCRGGHDVDSAEDQHLVLMTALELVDFGYLEDAAQARSLWWLDKLALQLPGVLVKL